MLNPKLEVNIIEQRDLSIEQKLKIVEMWNTEYPENITHPDISSFDNYLKNRGDKRHFLLIDRSNNICGWAMTFVRDNAKWFTIIIDQRMQGAGLGKKLLDTLKTAEKRLSGWVIDTENYKKTNGEIYDSPLLFYKKLGFTVSENERLKNDRISAVKIEWKV